MGKKTEFPEFIYVISEEDGDDSYFLTFESVNDLQAYNGKMAACYRLDYQTKVQVRVALETGK